MKAGKDAGEATFTVHHLGEERDIRVVITKARLTSLKASAKELVLKPGETMQLELIAAWSDETERDVGKQAVWTSRNKSVVEVTDTGELTAIQAGAGTIRADYGDRVVLVRVTVRPDEDALEKQTTQFANRLFLT
ncbi:Ig-like domain-containing protein [Brevibacillus agri]|uniref:Ig-like domain-containing protein n=1 Tax=Brevibacillus agri TaxID=51101 RepID=UPI0030F42B76